jgi:hypothetical protein
MADIKGRIKTQDPGPAPLNLLQIINHVSLKVIGEKAQTEANPGRVELIGMANSSQDEVAMSSDRWLFLHDTVNVDGVDNSEDTPPVPVYRTELIMPRDTAVVISISYGADQSMTEWPADVYAKYPDSMPLDTFCVIGTDENGGLIVKINPGTLQAVYQVKRKRWPAQMINDDDEPTIPAGFRWAIVYDMLAQCAAGGYFIQESSSATYWAQKRDRVISRMGFEQKPRGKKKIRVLMRPSMRGRGGNNKRSMRDCR